MRAFGTETGEGEGRFAGAAGLAATKRGFCFSPDYDALFALGWPHVRFVADGRRGDPADPAGAARLLLQPDPPARFVWPRPVAQALVRAWGLPSLFELAPGSRRLRGEAEEVAWRTEPISASEAVVLVRTRVGHDLPGVSERAVASFVLLLEALVGAERVGEAIVDALERLPLDTLFAVWTLPPLVTWQLGFLMLRVPTDLAESWRGRLRSLFDSALELRPVFRRQGLRGAGSTHVRALHLVLDGAAAAEASSDHTLRWYAHVTDDPVLVRMRVAVNRQGYEPDARLVFLGGVDVLDRYALEWPRLATAEAQRYFFEQVAPIRAARMFPLMLEMAGCSLVRAQAERWFVTHATESAAFLDAAADGEGSPATWARQVLTRIAER